jgi:2-polyprenyl-3-methyl-5-hydroxy-6-metoxy-1,4-benzoquinol methylase
MTMEMLRRIQHMRQRRRALSQELDVWRRFDVWEESCVPSYCHSNWLAAFISWQRLFKAVELARRYGRPGPVLDFGASVGELGQLLSHDVDYHYIEQDDAPATYLQRALPHAVRRTLEGAPENAYAVVFALDALEHNENYPDLLAILASKLSKDGVLILSGPTENLLYRLGRKIAGFNAHYHVTNINLIEDAAASRLVVKKRRTVPFGVPLFRLSVWVRPQA